MIRTALLLIMIIAFLSGVEPKRYHSIAGPFRIVMKHMGSCYEVPDAERDKTIQVRMKEFHNGRDPEVMYNGSFYTPIPFSNMVSGVLTLFSWNGVRGWQDNAHNIRVGGMCAYVENWFPSIFNKVLMGIGGELFTCPYMAGYYKFENVKISSTDLPFKEFFYGKWKAQLHLFYGSSNKEKGCLEVFADTVPR